MSKYRKKKDNEEYSKEFRQHQEKIDFNIDLLSKRDCFKNYIYLNKLLNPNRNSLKKKLYQFNGFAYDNVLNPSTSKDGNLTFFISNRYLAQVYGSDKKAWSKAINTHFFLGLLKKYAYHELQDTQAKRMTKHYKDKKQKELNQNTYAISHYFVPKYDNDLLVKADDKARQLLEKKYTIGSFGKDWLKLNFGKDVANEIYPYEQPINPLDDYIKPLLKKHIERSVKEQGYITPRELQARVKKAILKELPDEHNIKSKIKQIYDLHIDDILKELGYILINANKELQERFNLETHIKIIYEPE